MLRTNRARTNFFRVRNRRSFEQFCERAGLIFIEHGDHVGFIDASGEFQLSGEREQEVEVFGEHHYVNVPFDLLCELAGHLTVQSVAVVFVVGYDCSNHATAYLHGGAYAVNSRDERFAVTLTDIYDLGDYLGDEIIPLLPLGTENTNA